MVLQRRLLAAVFASTILLACSSSDKTTSPEAGTGPGVQDSSTLSDQQRKENRFTWTRAPAGFPSGAQMAVVQGEPGKAGAIFTIRLRFPDGYVLPPHVIPATQYMTVLHGTFLAGIGETFSGDVLVPFAVGDFAALPGRIPHFGTTRGNTEVQVHGVGPFALTYVHPGGDPSGR